jgi:hypothetical protein
MKHPNLDQYVQLRTLLDSLEIGALRYYLEPDDTVEQDERFVYLNKHLKPVIDKIWGGRNQMIDCPVGYHECDGCCVPYPCLWSTE